jgi:hypothetical protein
VAAIDQTNFDQIQPEITQLEEPVVYKEPSNYQLFRSRGRFHTGFITLFALSAEKKTTVATESKSYLLGALGKGNNGCLYQEYQQKNPNVTITYEKRQKIIEKTPHLIVRTGT